MLISVVIPVYNVEKYLSKAVESVIEQTYNKLEIILVDDGSTDNCAEICDSFAEKDSRVIVIHQKNSGLSGARNAGIKMASGDYIFFLDSDDYIEPDTLEFAVKNAQLYKTDLVIWGYITEYENKQQPDKEIRVPDCLIYEGNNDLDYVPSCIGYAWNKLYNRDIIERNNLEFRHGVSLVEDILFNRDYIAHVSRILFVDKCFNHYLQRNVPTLGTKQYDNALELKMMSLDAWQDILKKMCFKPDIRNSYISNMKYYTVSFFVRMTARNTELNFNERVKLIRRYLSDDDVKKLIGAIKTYGIKNKVIYELMKLKVCVVLTAILSI
jgi:glycosyltransferase involved in cell wall biosynthesis